MPSRFRWFFYGVFLTAVVIFGGAYGYLASGYVSMATSAPPLPLEETVARITLEAPIQKPLRWLPWSSRTAEHDAGQRDVSSSAAAFRKGPDGDR